LSKNFEYTKVLHQKLLTCDLWFPSDILKIVASYGILVDPFAPPRMLGNHILGGDACFLKTQEEKIKFSALLGRNVWHNLTGRNGKGQKSPLLKLWLKTRILLVPQRNSGFSAWGDLSYHFPDLFGERSEWHYIGEGNAIDSHPKFPKTDSDVILPGFPRDVLKKRWYWSTDVKIVFSVAAQLYFAVEFALFQNWSPKSCESVITIPIQGSFARVDWIPELEELSLLEKNH